MNFVLREIIESLGLTDTVLMTLAAIGLTASIVVEQAQLLVKYNGIVRKKIAGGYNNAMKIMVLNRFGTVLYFLFVAMSIDVGISGARMTGFFAASFIVIALINLIIFLELRRRLDLHFSLFRQLKVRSLPVFMALISTLFGCIGLTLPMLLSAENPPMRLTMANTGFIFNSLFTIATVFFVESYLADLIDDFRGDGRTGYFVASVFLMRFVALLACVGVILVLGANSYLLRLSTWL